MLISVYLIKSAFAAIYPPECIDDQGTGGLNIGIIVTSNIKSLGSDA
jgi:hypothetical protein